MLANRVTASLIYFILVQSNQLRMKSQSHYKSLKQGLMWWSCFITRSVFSKIYQMNVSEVEVWGASWEFKTWSIFYVVIAVLGMVVVVKVRFMVALFEMI